MQETTGDLFSIPGDAHVITTNGAVRKDHCAVMGRGCAKKAADRYPDLPRQLGNRLEAFGNYPYVFDPLKLGSTDWHNHLTVTTLITMPVKHHWKQDADPRLIKRAAYGLAVLVNQHPDWTRIILPRPGCGAGNLLWEDVKPLLEDFLDSRFISTTFA